MKNKFQLFKLFLLGLVFFSSSFSFAQDDEPLIPEYISTEGLVGWWPFNGNADDESGNGNFGTVNRAKLTTDRFDKANRAYQFDGIYSYVVVDVLNQSLMLGNNFSISFWTKIIFNNHNQHTLIAKGDGMSNEYSIVCNQDNVIQFVDPGKNIQQNMVYPGFNVWTNIICVMENGLGKIYINGNLVTTIPNIRPILASNLPLVFGAQFETGTNTPIRNSYLVGKMDDIAIWNRVLTKDEISALSKADF